MSSWIPQNVLGEDDVGRVDRVRAGGERDVLEPVGRADRVHLRAEDPPVRQRLGQRLVLSRNPRSLLGGGTVYPAARPDAHTGG